jgi:hypothetical protein
MKAFAVIQPTRRCQSLTKFQMDSVQCGKLSLVTGNAIIRLEEGDIVPPVDCIVLELLVKEELLVDLPMISGEERVRSVSTTTTTSDGNHNHNHNLNNNNHMATLNMGGKVVQGVVWQSLQTLDPTRYCWPS